MLTCDFSNIPHWIPRLLLILFLIFLALYLGFKFKNHPDKQIIKWKSCEVSKIPIEVLWWVVVFYIVGWIWTTNPPYENKSKTFTSSTGGIKEETTRFSAFPSQKVVD
ncbi:MAG: hypothetical protein QNJ31_02710 [Candidatus Caenarcaniphilales bacterium]|nr:hypothetical protein [Candidatus Caenarcaniphilales bacterium]